MFFYVSASANRNGIRYVSTHGLDQKSCGHIGDSPCLSLEYIMPQLEDGVRVYLAIRSEDHQPFINCKNADFLLSGSFELVSQGNYAKVGCFDDADDGNISRRYTIRFSHNQPGKSVLLRNLWFRNVDVVLDGLSLNLDHCIFENANIQVLNAKGRDYLVSVVATHSKWHGRADCEGNELCEPNSGLLVWGNASSVMLVSSYLTQTRVNISSACDTSVIVDKTHFTNSAMQRPVMGGIFITLHSHTYNSSVIVRDSMLENQIYWNPVGSVMNIFMATLLVRLFINPRNPPPQSNVVQVLVSNVTFRNNERAITFQGNINNIKIQHSVFDDNIAMHAGAGILHLNKNTTTLYNCTFQNNAAGTYRSISPGKSVDYFHLDGDEANVNSNCCKGKITLIGKGGAIRVQFGIVQVISCRFYNNTARILGGTVFIDREGIFIIQNSNFSNSPHRAMASQQGDILYSNGKAELSGCSISAESAHNHISLLQHSGDHWSIAVFEVTVDCPIGHRLRVMNTSAYRVAAGRGLQGSYMLDQLSYFCESCPRHRYSTDHGRLRYKLQKGLLGYFTLMINGERPVANFNGTYQYHDIQCEDCPYGANCDEKGIRAVPNFWGYRTSDRQLRFQLCARGYCCSKMPCKAYDTCSNHRTGVLCGKCEAGYAEALFSSKCVEETMCGPLWIWPFACATGILYALFLLFQKDIRDFIFTRPTKLRDMNSCCCCCCTNKGNHCSCLSLVTPVHHEVNTSILEPNDNQIVMSSIKIRESTSLQETDACEGNGSLVVEQAPPPSPPTDVGSIMLIIVLYYFQDAMLFHVKTVFAVPENRVHAMLKTVLLGLFKFRLEVAHFVDNVCLFPGLSASQKLLAKTVLVPYVVVLFGFIYVMYMLKVCLKRPNNFFRRNRRNSTSGTNPAGLTFLTRISTGFMLSLLFLYQRLATTAFTLLNCVLIDDKRVLLIDGNVECYQMWQYGVMIYAMSSIVPFCSILMLGPGLLKEGRIGLPTFFTACIVPLPFALYWFYYRLYLSVGRERSNLTQHTMSAQCESVVKVLQGPFKDLRTTTCGPICWAGVLIFRRLILILLYTFINNSLIRVTAMLVTCFFILLQHVHIQPYKDSWVNIAGSASVSALMIVGGINLIRAGFEAAEYIPQGPNHMLILVMQETENVLMLWFPLVIMSVILLALVLKIVYTLITYRR